MFSSKKLVFFLEKQLRNNLSIFSLYQYFIFIFIYIKFEINLIHKTIKHTLFQNITNFPCCFLYNNKKMSELSMKNIKYMIYQNHNYNPYKFMFIFYFISFVTLACWNKSLVNFLYLTCAKRLSRNLKPGPEGHLHPVKEVL